MTPKRKASPSSSQSSKKPHHSNSVFNRRDGLGAYTLHPEKYNSSVVIYHNENFVAINDLYPKSSVHTLLLPRSTNHNYLHPFDAFEDPEFLSLVQAETTRLVSLVAKELQRKYGPFSKQDSKREAILNGEVDIPDGEDLPEGRDWKKEVRAGIHAHPSMNHLHVHVMSVDRSSECLRHRKHYNSFATPFFVPVEDFPLAKDDVRRHPGKEGYLQRDMECWRCGRNFGNRFAKLKEHLAEEFEEWKAE
jgi:aprataxin